ncbi:MULTISPECIES: hypothetical protein [unclassified Nostoc]|uniref:hypothetical protein n=1 Tax=unclassified Nostoc TaxID=2593658 RepID=UPI002AD22EB9|nr:hypothetical protein [Nostoc sp. DedQUE03]MDZ7977631.1 hypothetical protein [Nostoc sp. DedQUE03]MDZ8049258.1 hypothetical protein [Nostoc sp. DedQUE02]
MEVIADVAMAQAPAGGDRSSAGATRFSEVGEKTGDNALPRKMRSLVTIISTWAKG